MDVILYKAPVNKGIPVLYLKIPFKGVPVLT